MSSSENIYQMATFLADYTKESNPQEDWIVLKMTSLNTVLDFKLKSMIKTKRGGGNTIQVKFSSKK